MTTEKKKLNKEDYMFTKKKGEELIKKPGDVNGLQFVINYLEDCTVYILDHSAQVIDSTRLLELAYCFISIKINQESINTNHTPIIIDKHWLMQEH